MPRNDTVAHGMDARLICCMLRQVKWSVLVTGSASSCAMAGRGASATDEHS